MHDNTVAVRVISCPGQDPVLTMSVVGEMFTLKLNSPADIDRLIRELQMKKQDLSNAIHQRIGELASLLPKQ